MPIRLLLLLTLCCWSSISLARQKSQCFGLFSLAPRFSDYDVFGRTEVWFDDPYLSSLRAWGTSPWQALPVTDKPSYDRTPQRLKQMLAERKERSLLLRDRVAQKIQSRSDNQFLIVFQGLFHSYDLFKTIGRRSDVGYVTPSLRPLHDHPVYLYFQKHFLGLRLQPAEIQVLWRIFGDVFPDFQGSSYRPLFLQLALDGATGTTTAISDNSHRSGWFFEEAVDAWESASGDPLPRGPLSTLILNDFHFMTPFPTLYRFPSADELKARGITEVEILLEGAPAGAVIPAPRVRAEVEIFIWQRLMQMANEEQRRSIESLFASNSRMTRVKEILTQHPIQFMPGLIELVQDTMRGYANQQIQIRFVGIGDNQAP